MTESRHWQVIFHDEFLPEFAVLSEEVQDALLSTAATVRELGPGAGRPHVGTLKNPKHPNMKELRFETNNGVEIWRVAFAFDPRREAIVLVAADKQGIDEKKFYRDLLKKANARFSQHLKNLTSTTAPRRAAGAGCGREGQRQEIGAGHGTKSGRYHQ